jgi:hypothetical protein
LRWLAGHAPDQVVILFGNHDAARVMELIGESDASFAAARELAARDGSSAEFHRRFPCIPTPGIAVRDYNSYCEAQRELVIELLLAGRFRLGIAGAIGGREALLTHAAVTAREIALLGLEEACAPAAVIAAHLDARLRSAVADVAERWQRGERPALDLSPLHVAGTTGQEGGGLLYHRPSNPLRTGADPAWELDRERPRRYHPSNLPPGLLQVCGHTTHKKCLAELGDWVTPAARTHARTGKLRSLVAPRDGEGSVTYQLGVAPAVASNDTALILIDGELAHHGAAVELLELSAVEV